MTISLKLPPGVDAAVKLDGLPRLVSAVEFDGDTATGVIVPTVVYLENGFALAMPAANWPPPLPVNPTAEQIAAAIAALVAEAEADRQAIVQLRQQVLQTLDPLSGQLASAPLTNAQAQAFIKALVYLAGGINPRTGAYRDPREWLK